MNEQEIIQLARAYVALSNAHQTNFIDTMLTNQTVYQSSAVGSFTGNDEIIEMMRGFFNRYPDVYWKVETYRVEKRRVSFEFEMTATDSGNNDPLQRRGIEFIEFDHDGKIERIEVNAS